MGYEDLIKIQETLDNTQKLWNKVEQSKERFKVCVQYNSKVIFYEDLYNHLSTEDKEGISSAEELRDNLNMFFKCENANYHFIKTYKEFALRRFENGYLWNKITSEKKYNNLYKEVEIIDKNNTYKGVAIKYSDLYNVVKQDYSRYFKTKREMKKVLKTYFDKKDIISSFTDDKELFDDFTSNAIKLFKNK